MLGQLFQSSPSRGGTLLRVALGLSSGDTSDRFLIALAVLSLLSEVAEEPPQACFVDEQRSGLTAPGPDPRIRGATAVGGVGGDGVRGARAKQRASARWLAGVGARRGWKRRTHEPCWQRSSRTRSMTASATQSIRKLAGTPWRCWS